MHLHDSPPEQFERLGMEKMKQKFNESPN